jgi:hypothetical protein
VIFSPLVNHFRCLNAGEGLVSDMIGSCVIEKDTVNILETDNIDLTVKGYKGGPCPYAFDRRQA